MTGAVSQMRNDRAARCRLRVNTRKNRGNILVGKTVESVAPDALLGELSRQGKGLGHGRNARVKRGIEAGHLGHIGPSLSDDTDGGKVVRLMQRRQGIEFFQIRQDLHR